MSRTRRKVPHWVEQWEQWYEWVESIGLVLIGWPRSKSTAMNLRQRIATGNFNHSDKEARRNEDRKRRLENKAIRSDEEN